MNHAFNAKLDETIVCTRALIAEQRACIDRLEAERRDSSRQKEFLATFEALLAVQEARRKKDATRWWHLMIWSPMPAAAERRREVA